MRAFNADGKAVYYAGSSTVSTGLMATYNPAGERVVFAGTTASGKGILQVSDEQGRETWSSDKPGGTSSTLPTKVGDLDGDNDVDFNDFLLFATNFGK